MNIETLMNKKITRKDFIKSLGFIIFTLVIFPKNALSFFNEESENELEKIYVDGRKAIEIIDE